jgi:hypothetical protein
VAHALVEPSVSGGAEGHFLRARITLRAAARGDVRVDGNRIYFDLQALEARQTPPAGSTAPRLPAAAATATSQTDVQQAALTRLREVQPFVLSAVQSPTPDVLRALSETLGTVEESLRAAPPAPNATGIHATLMSSARMARGAVAADFTGDRAAQARAAFTLLEAAAADLSSLSR